MDDGNGDDFAWDGLACPPLEESAFDFNDTSYKLDGILDDLLFEDEEEHEEEHSTMVNVGGHCYAKGNEWKTVEQVLEVEKRRLTCYDCQLKDRKGLDGTNEVVGIDNKTDQDSGVDKKTNHRYGNHGRGKELKLNLNMAEIKAFLEEETQEVLEKKDKKRKIVHGDNCQPVQPKDRVRLNRTTQLAVVENKRKADFDLKLEASSHTLHESHKSTCQPMLRKDMKRLDHTKQLGPVDNKRKADIDLRLETKRHKLHDTYESTCQPKQRKDRTRLDHMNRPVLVENKKKADIDFRLEASRHKLHNSYESACQPMWPEERVGLDYTNQLAVADKKMHADFNSRFEATRKKLHESYKLVREAKQTKRIQVIDFQKPVMVQPRCQAKSKGKSSLRQRLTAMGTHKGNKRLQLSVY